MIQRIQTLYMLAAFILCVLCLSLPIGAFVPEGLGDSCEMYNLWIRMGNGNCDFSVWGLFVILLLSCPLVIAAIFLYKNRRLQARVCVFSILMLVGWYIVYGIFAFNLKDSLNAGFIIRLPAVFPFIALVFLVLARKAILADEALVKAADRIR